MGQRYPSTCLRRFKILLAHPTPRVKTTYLEETVIDIISRMRHLPFILICFVITTSIAYAGDAIDPPATPSQVEFFEKKVRPILATHCYECHSAGAKKLQANLLLDSRARMIQGGESGTALVPNDVDNSSLITAVRFESYEMPPKGKLPDADIEALETWVKMGAPWPEEPEPVLGKAKPTFELQARQQSHWMWQPIVEPPLPAIGQNDWPLQPLDGFILAKLEASKLNPAPPVDRHGLIRRLSFDLLGLPPSPKEVEEFVDNKSSHAVEELVDSMLRSPRFGERWGRHWLDLVRYAESRGHEFDADTSNAHQYRDYIIRAFNADVPYDQLVREHVAGDLLDQPRLNPETGANESVLGTGFWYLGEWVHSPVDIRRDETDRFDNMIDVMSKTFLGITVSCARCHDHKFDAISSRDYYALTGFLQGSEYRQVRFETIEKERSTAAQLTALDKEFEARVKNTVKSVWETHRAEIVDRQNQASPLTAASKLSPKANPKLKVTNPEDRIVVDYTSNEPSRLIQDGFIFGSTASPIGSTVLDPAGAARIQLTSYAAARNDLFWNGLVSKAEKPTNTRSPIESLPRPSRTLLTPSFDVTHGFVSCLVKGNGHVVANVDSHRLVVGPLHGETIQEIKSEDPNPRWIVMNLSRYIGHRVHLEFTPANNGLLEILGVVDGKGGQNMVSLEPSTPSKLAEAGNFETILSAAVSDWTLGKLDTGLSIAEQTAAINWLLAESGRAELEELAKQWISERQSLRVKLPNESATGIAMVDCTGEDDRVLIRGSSSVPGEVVHRRFLEAIDGDSPLDVGPGSGRLRLAERITADNNPLTSRVIVNRIWHHLMGRGIVPTVDDFGVLGQSPTDQALLDHLAVWFANHGHSIKGLIRYITLSRTYQMSGAVSQESLAVDPKNLMLQHVAPKRLAGEAIRDSLLSITGELDLSMYGEPVPIHLTPFMDGRGRPGASGPLDGNKRRSIYVATRRNFLSPFMLTFDTPNPFSTMGKRNVSNVPAQALIMMNDPFVIERSTRWAERALREEPVSQEARVRWMYMTALSRPPKNEELQIAKSFIEAQARNRSTTESDVSVWTDFAHAMINLKEFVFLR